MDAPPRNPQDPKDPPDATGPVSLSRRVWSALAAVACRFNVVANMCNKTLCDDDDATFQKDMLPACQPAPKQKKKKIRTCATFNHSVLQNQNSYIFLFNLLANFTQNVNNGHVSHDVTTNWIKMKAWETERALFKGPILPRLSCKEHL